MSARTLDRVAKKVRGKAPVFAALGDETRLSLLLRLGSEGRLSITQLSADVSVTRQAITKHLRVLEGAGLVHSVREGRENLYQLDPTPLAEAGDTLEVLSRQWDDALARLKAFVEKR